MTYLKDRGITNSVYYQLRNKKSLGPIVGPEACYSDIMNHGGIQEDTTAVYVHQPLDSIAFENKEINRWIEDLNEMGFPCIREKARGRLRIKLPLEDYKGKNHLASALMLIRLLWEHNSSSILDLYFRAIDKNPKADKILTIQRAHKHPSLKEGKGDWAYSTYNSGHTVTYHSRRKNITRAKLFENFENGPAATAEGYSSVNAAWGVGDPEEENDDYGDWD